MKIPTLSDWERFTERWIATFAEFEHRLENYWFNAGLSIAVISVWCLLATPIALAADPFTFLIWIQTQNTLFGIACILALIVFILFWIAKPSDTRGKTILLFIGWAVIMAAVYNAIHPEEISEVNGFMTFCYQFYRGHPSFLFGWYVLLALHTLVFIHRNERVKLPYYYCCLVGGFITLTLFYVITPAVGFLLAVTVPHEFFNRWLKAASENDVLLRGSKLTPTNKARYDYRKRLDAESRVAKETFPFGGLDIPVRELTTHLVAVGSSGSGKSITLKLIMQACLPMVTPVNGVRAVVFDPKHNALAEISGINGISADIITLNAFQRGAVRYDMAKDYTSYVHAQSFADTLIPEPHNNEKSDKFFRDAAVNILTGITLLFINNAPNRWRLRDLVLAFSSQKVLTALLASDSQSAYYLNSLGSEKTATNILASVCAEIYRYLPIAALWEKATTSVSVSQWLEGGQIWLLGEDEEARPAMNALNRLILTRMSQSLLKESDYPEPRTFIFIDELQSIHVEALLEVATKGRSKGICLIPAFQSIQGMVHCYGREVTDSILGQIRHKAYLKMSDAATGEWASSQLGDMEVRRQQANTSFDSGMGGLIGMSKRVGGSQTIQQTKLVIPSQFTDIPSVDPKTGQGLTGYFQTSSINYKNYTPWKVLKQQLQPADEFVHEVAAPAHWQRLEPWSPEDWERLGIADVMYFATMDDETLKHTDDYSSEGGRYYG
ncbi:MAG: type IV secretion system DNA-binding domain-containing protein [Iphinoe sp. HA4291-MV1]|jgi:type IV secretory pathway TraG/TraD family ATPase VirD4|nr:type IV secretion system DNA-binding domain-containing protein [Iphinoe sp. HA4291-MV1]